MHNFQIFIKNNRESKKISIGAVADEIKLSKETIKMIEEAENNDLLSISNSILKNNVRKYCEYLEISEKKIFSILNKIDVLYYKRSRHGKLKLFDYLNRILIVIIIVTLITIGAKQIRNNMETSEIVKDYKTPVIYNNINYDDTE